MNRVFNLEDKIHYLILLSTSLVLGYLIACCIAGLSQSGDKLGFVRKNGFALAMYVLIAFPSAFFSALFVAFVITVAHNCCFSDPFSSSQRLVVMESAYITCFVALVIYAARQAVKDGAPNRPSTPPPDRRYGSK